MTAIILAAVAVAMIGAHIAQRLVHKHDVKDATERAYYRGYRDAVAHDHQINHPLETIIRHATNNRKDT